MRLGLLSSEDGPAAGISGSGGASARSPAELPSGGLPPRVHSVIAGRLAQLSAPARQAAGLAATIGRAFSFEVLVRASGADEDALVRWLDELWQRRIVRDVGGNTYDFTHDKLREVAYAEASPPARARLHRRVARSLEEVHARDLDAVSGQLAVHYDRAGLPEQAISFYHRAAAVAQRVGANHEAEELLRRALALLPRLGAGPGRDERELDLQLALGASVVGSLGHGAPEVASVYARAQELCERLARPPSAPILRALAIYHIVKADFGQARRYGQELLALGETQRDAITRVEGNYVLGVALSWQGEFTSAQRYLAEAIARYSPRQAHSHIASYSQDPKVICLGRLAFDLWCLGYPDQAVAASDEALAYARKIAHPFSQAYAMFWDSLLQNHLRAFGLARDRAEAMIAYCREYDLDFWLPTGVATHGWALAELGEVQGGIASIQAGMEGWRAHGLEFKRPLFLSLLATQHGRAGNIRHGLALLDEALVLVERESGGARPRCTGAGRTS
jgi:tetratricopeptide (TPR) repeat protein